MIALQLIASRRITHPCALATKSKHVAVFGANAYVVPVLCIFNTYYTPLSTMKGTGLFYVFYFKKSNGTIVSLQIFSKNLQRTILSLYFTVRLSCSTSCSWRQNILLPINQESFDDSLQSSHLPGTPPTNMTSTRCACEKRYKAAIALNNAALSLLAKERYKLAMDMFRVAMNLIQLSCCVLGDIDQLSLPEPILVPGDLISHHLNIALHCQAEESDSCLGEPVNPNNATSIFSSQMDVWQVRDAIQKKSFDNTKVSFYYINIDPIDHEDLSLVTAYQNSIVILYNYGVAHCNLAHQLESLDDLNNSFARALRQASFQIFYVIDVYVRRMLENPSLSQENVVLLLSALFTRTMSQLANEVSCATISYYYNMTFEAILCWIEMQHKLFPIYETQAAAA